MRRRKAGKPQTDFDSQPGTPNPEKRKKSRANVVLEKGAPNPPEVTKQLKKLLHTVLQHEDRLDSALSCRCHTIFHNSMLRVHSILTHIVPQPPLKITPHNHPSQPALTTTMCQALIRGACASPCISSLAVVYLLFADIIGKQYQTPHCSSMALFYIQYKDNAMYQNIQYLKCRCALHV